MNSLVEVSRASVAHALGSASRRFEPSQGSGPFGWGLERPSAMLLVLLQFRRADGQVVRVLADAGVKAAKPCPSAALSGSRRNAPGFAEGSVAPFLHHFPGH